MKKTIGMMAALMLMAGGAMACAQQPEKKDAPETTEASAPAKAADEQEAEKSDTSTAAPAAEENKAESAGTGEGNSSAASEDSASSAE